MLDKKEKKMKAILLENRKKFIIENNKLFKSKKK